MVFGNLYIKGATSHPNYLLVICLFVQAFGVGAFEDDDDDIYAADSMDNYDITMSNERNPDSTYGWTKPKAIAGM